MVIPFRIIFLRLRHEKRSFCGINFCDIGILWKKCGIYFCNLNKICSTKSKKEDTIYVGIIDMSFLSRNLLCKNVYTMSSFIMNMSDMLLNGILSDSHSSSSSLSSLMSRAAKKSMSLGLLAFLKWFDYPRWLTGRYYKTNPRVRDLLFLIQWLLCENCFPAISVLRPT